MKPDVAALFDRVADTYDAVGVPWFGPVAEMLVAELAPVAGETAVDIGCGRGAVTRPLAEAVGATGRVVGIDLAPGMVERTAADLGHLPQVQVQIGDARAPDLPVGQWDLVASSLVLFFLSEPGVALRRWVELLRPGGRLGITTFGPQDERWSAVDAVFTPHLPHAMLDARASGRRGPFASDEGMESLLGEAGLCDVWTVSQTVHARFADVEQWHAWSWSHGQRAMWEAVPTDRRHEVKAQAVAMLESFDDLSFSQVVRTTLGRR